MTHCETPEISNPLLIISRLMGQNIKAAAVVCSNGEDEFTSVTAYISPKEASPRFRHAIDMECSYNHTLLAFSDIPPPYYGHEAGLDLKHAAAAIGVDRILCVVTMSSDDMVSGMRDYEGVEVTVIEAATEQLTQFKDLLVKSTVHRDSMRLQ